MQAFQQIQQQWTQFLRTPAQSLPPANVDNQRLAVYRQLILSNISSLLKSTFPVLHGLLTSQQWDKLIEAYCTNHAAQTPLFTQFATEFLEFLVHYAENLEDYPPFILELAHYEWLEWALFIEPSPTNAPPFAPISTISQLWQFIPALSPFLSLQCYHYPVHQICVDYQPLTPPTEATYLLVYRDKIEQIQFVLLNPVSARLLEKLLNNTDKTAHALLIEIAEELQHPQADQVINHGQQLLSQWFEMGIIIGQRL